MYLVKGLAALFAMGAVAFALLVGALYLLPPMPQALGGLVGIAWGVVTILAWHRVLDRIDA